MWSHPLIHLHQSSISSFASVSHTHILLFSLIYSFACGGSEAQLKEPKVAFERAVCQAVFATGPPRYIPKLCFRSQQDERDLVIFCSFP